MRIGVDLRVLAAGRSAATRGMPRFTQQQLREVLRRDGEDEFLVFLTPNTEPSLLLPELRNAANLAIRFIPPELATKAGDPAAVRRNAGLLAQWIAGQGIDLYHAATPFYLEQLVLPRLDACPVVSTLYDLIPMVYPAHYLLDERIAQDYVRAAGFVAGATRVLAISESARRSGNMYLGIPLDAIDVALPFAEPFFRPLTTEETDSTLTRLERGRGLPASFLLAVPHLHFSKNIEGLLRAYALVPSAIRRRAPLVLTCHLDPHGELRVRRLARLLRISDDLVITGMVDDAELVALYNRALFVVHPSRYEGFGLPVVEAMQCGSAVVTSTSSSLPEAAGDAALLVDPDDAPALADAMVSLYEDDAFRDELGRRGLARAAVFGPDQLAEATLRSYRLAIVGGTAEGRPDEALRRPPVGLSKACEVEDFDDEGVAGAITDLGLDRRHGPRAWRQALALHAVRTSGCVAPGARALLIDDGGTAIAGALGASVDVVRLPSASGGAGRLPFADATFDVVVSCGSLQGLDGFDQVAGAAYEMGRVLKPGGVLSISTDLVVAGPPSGVPGGLVFSPDLLQRYVIDASGLEPIGTPNLVMSTSTLESERDMGPVRRGRSGTWRPAASERPGRTPVLQVRDGCVVGAVHLALRKTEPYPARINDWAQPPALARVAPHYDRSRPAVFEPAGNGSAPVLPSLPDHRARVEQAVSDIMTWQAEIDTALRELETMLAEAVSP